MKRTSKTRFVGVLAVISGLFFGSASIAAPKSPQPEQVAAEINRLLRETWSEAFTNAAPMATQGALFRRLSIDLRGVIPYPDEIDQFLNDRSKNKISKWSNWFLQTPEHAEFQAETWEHTLIGRKGDTDGLDRGSFRTWLRKSFLENKPYNELANEILLSAGLPKNDPAVNFYLRYEAKPVDMAGKVARVFLGTRIECAQCHDHPYADVKREEFFGFAAFFARTQRYRDYDRAGGNSRIYGIRSRPSGELTMPPMKTGQRPMEIQPMYFGVRYDRPKNYSGLDPIPKKKTGPSKLDKKMDSKMMMARKGSRVTSYGASTRRKGLVKWLVSDKNKYFARSLVNRMWAKFLGKGFVNPIDDFSEDSKIILPEVLNYLTSDFVESGYDLKRLQKIIVLTKAYRQQAVQGVPGGIVPGEEHDLFTTIPIRPLEPEVLVRSVLRATGMEDPHPENNARQVKGYVQKAEREFVRRFGVDEAEKRMEFQGTVLQVLLLFNGEFTSSKAPASRPYHASYQKKYPGNLGVVLHGVAPARHVEQLFLATLGRSPSSAERGTFDRHAMSARDDAKRQSVLADIHWALLNSAEFLHSS
jgi:hypothetical protein